MEQHSRDIIRGELTLDYFAKKFAEGWKVRAIDWSREAREGAEAYETPFTHLLSEEDAVPFGYRLTGEKLLEENPLEATVLLLILEQIVHEKRIPEIAAQLNRQGYLTRKGGSWGPTEVFDLLPRVIEVGPTLLKSDIWRERRSTM